MASKFATLVKLNDFLTLPGRHSQMAWNRLLLSSLSAFAWRGSYHHRHLHQYRSISFGLGFVLRSLLALS